MGRKTEQTYTVNVLVTFMDNVAKFQPFAAAIKSVSTNDKPSDSNSWVGLLRVCARKTNCRIEVLCGLPRTLQPKSEIVEHEERQKNLLRSPDIVTVIRSRQLKWDRQVART